MTDKHDTLQLPATDITTPERERLRVAVRLQEIEGNPLIARDVAMFAMFEREGWSPEQRRRHILAEARPLAAE